MTIRTNSIQQCDRCLKPFQEKYLKSGDEVPAFKQKGLVVTETSGTSKDEGPKFTVLFSFEDICPKCQEVVANLLMKLRGEGKGAKKSRRVAKKRTSKKKEEAPAPTEEYTEAAPAEKSTPGGEPSTAKDTADRDFEEAGRLADANMADAEADENSGGGNGAEASSQVDTSGLVEDPKTGDKYDPNTGEVVVKGAKGDGVPESHPF